MSAQITYRNFHAIPITLEENMWIEGPAITVGGEEPPRDITHDLAVWIYAAQFTPDAQQFYREKFAAMSELELTNYMIEEEGVSMTHVVWVTDEHVQTLKAFAHAATNYPMSDSTASTLADVYLQVLLQLGVYVCKLPTTD